MNKIVKDDSTCVTIDDFILNVIDKPNNPIVFWDTCTLLNIIRFIYREDGTDSQFINKVIEISNKIKNDNVFSVSCEINISEWNDNIDKTLSDFLNDLNLTTNYHKNAINVINVLKGTSKVSESLILNNLDSELQNIALSIIRKTKFLKIDSEISFNALRRVEQKDPPARRKNEFKDCAIWETMLELNRKLIYCGLNQKRVFYTINTEDFCDKKGSFLPKLSSEAITLGFECATKLEDILKFL